MIMIKVTLAAILKARRPRLVQGARIDTVVAINLRCRGPMPVIMAGRDAAFHDVAVSGSALLLYDPPSKGARRSH